MEYTNRWNDFQIRDVVYFGNPPTDDRYERYDVVKWYKYDEPVKCYDLEKNDYVLHSEGCCSIGNLIWDKEECSMSFESCGTRYFKEYIDGLNEWLLNFCNRIEIEKRYDNE